MAKRSPGRKKTVQAIRDSVGSLPTGVEGQNIPTDYSIPSVGLEDVDRAVFNLFEQRIKMQVAGQRVYTFLTGGERFALVKKDRPQRDKNGALILPLVAIHRTGIEQSAAGVISGRGMGVDTGDMVIKRRVSQDDPKFQSLMNKLNIQNQDNVASQSNTALNGVLATRRGQPHSFNALTGELLAPDLLKNVFEILTIPYPRFYTALYEITFWAQYVQHMNQMVESFISSYDLRYNQFRLDTPKGYWFVGYVGDDWASDDNFSDYTEDERLVRVTFQLRVPAYIHATKNPGDPLPVRSYLSAPQISFGLYEGDAPVSEGSKQPIGSGDVDAFTLSDVDVLDKRADRVESERLFPQHVVDYAIDPFTGRKQTRLLRVISRNQRSGETVLSKRNIKKIEDINL